MQATIDLGAANLALAALGVELERREALNVHAVDLVGGGVHLRRRQSNVCDAKDAPWQ